MAVVDESARDGLAEPRLRNLAAEDGIDQGGLADPRLAEDGEVEAAEGREGLGEALREEGLDLGLAEIDPLGRRGGGAGLRGGHGFTVSPRAG